MRLDTDSTQWTIPYFYPDFPNIELVLSLSHGHYSTAHFAYITHYHPITLRAWLNKLKINAYIYTYIWWLFQHILWFSYKEHPPRSTVFVDKLTVAQLVILWAVFGARKKKNLGGEANNHMGTDTVVINSGIFLVRLKEVTKKYK